MKNKLSMDFPCYGLYNVSVADYIEPYKEYRTLRNLATQKVPITWFVCIVNEKQVTCEKAIANAMNIVFFYLHRINFIG